MFRFLSIFLFFSLIITSCNSKNDSNNTIKPSTVVSPNTQNTSVSNTNTSNNQPQTTTTSPIIVPQTPIVNIKGFSKGQKFSVEGPFSSGEAEITDYSNSLMSISIVMNVPSVPLPYEVKDGKISVEIKLEKDANSKYGLTLNDLNKKYKYFTDQVKIIEGKTEAGWFSSAKDFVKISAYQEYTFTVENENTVTISTAPVPVSLKLTKKN